MMLKVSQMFPKRCYFLHNLHFFTFAMKMLGPVPSRSGPRLHSLQQELANITIHPRRVGGMNFPSSAEGEGAFNAPPSNSAPGPRSDTR